MALLALVCPRWHGLSLETFPPFSPLGPSECKLAKLSKSSFSNGCLLFVRNAQGFDFCPATFFLLPPSQIADLFRRVGPSLLQAPSAHQTPYSMRLRAPFPFLLGYVGRPLFFFNLGAGSAYIFFFFFVFFREPPKSPAALAAPPFFH